MPYYFGGWVRSIGAGLATRFTGFCSNNLSASATARSSCGSWPFNTSAGVFGPKVMIINESAGSGGDALPYYFKLRKLGPLVGTRTWGALVGTTGVPPTIDGGGITAPSLAFYDLQGRWAVENEGVTPDVEVEYAPADVIRGHDPQLERAVAEGLKLLERSPVKRVGRPAPIDRVHP